MEEEEKKPRETANMKEVLALAKDAKAGIDFGKKVYANRAVISRRMNVFTLIVSGIFTLLYATYIIVTSLLGKLALDVEIVIYCLLGAYVLVLVALVVFAALSTRTTAKNIKKFSAALKVFRLTLRVISIAISIAAIAVTVAAESSITHVSVDIIIVILSVLLIIVQLLPMIFGGVKELVRWLLSPVTSKMRFTAVAMEWYQLAQTGKKFGSGKKVDKRHYESIGSVIDEVLTPAIGKKYVNTIKPATIAELVENCPEERRQVAEGVLKSVFAYATECGYVVTDPCAGLHLSGTVEKKTMKDRFSGLWSIFGRRPSAQTEDNDDDEDIAATDEDE